MPTGSGVASLVLLFGNELGRHWKLDGTSFVLGREDDCEVVLTGDEVSRRHARLRADGSGWLVEDLGSRNGTLHNGALLARARPLRTGDVVAVGRNVLKFIGGESVEALFLQEMSRLACVDPLTRVACRQSVLEALERELGRCSRHGRPCGLMLVDVDCLKTVNDTLGHLAGDFALREVAAALQLLTRREAVVGRLGGDEFLVVVPEADRAALERVGERLRGALEGRDWHFQGRRLALTVSIGVAVSPPIVARSAEMLAAADEKLFSAKRTGRNRVVA